MRNHPLRKRRQRGFSLLEVLVAFAVLTLSLGVLFQVFSSSLRNTQISARYSEALLLAEGRQAVAANLLERGSEQGEAGEYRWRSETSEFDLEEDFTSTSQVLLRIETTVSWSERGGQRQVQLLTLRLGEVE